MKIAWHQWWPWRAWRVLGYAEAADEVPLRLPRSAIVLVGTPAARKWAVFDCPCRAGHRIMLPLSKRAMPHWSIVDENSMTLTPSVDAWEDDRRCHYFIRRGKTVWVEDESQGRTKTSRR